MLNDEGARKIGASDMPTLLGMSEWSGPIALWARIVHGIQGGSNEAMEAGNAAEDYNRALYRNRTGFTLLGPSKWTHPMHPWMRCSPDDRAIAPSGRRLVELKRYNYTVGWGAEGSDAVPAHIWVQVQMQAGVGLDNGEVDDSGVDVSALLRGELRLYHVAHVPEVYERCVEAAERFWRDFVVPARLPDGPNLRLLERDSEAISVLFPKNTSDAPVQWASLTEAQHGTVRRWLEANRSRKAWEKQEEALAMEMALLLKEAPGLAELPVDAGAKRVDFKAQAGAARVDVKALRAALDGEPTEFRTRMVELIEKHTEKHTTRPLVAR